MKNIFIGFLVIFLDFTLTIGRYKIGLIPDFIGYIVLINGLSEMSEESVKFENARLFAVGMIIYSGAIYFCDFIGITLNLGSIAIISGLVATIISLYISYIIIDGIRDVEANRSADLNGIELKYTWNVMAVFSMATYLSLFIPALSIVFVIISLIMVILFLIALNKSRNAYYELPDIEI